MSAELAELRRAEREYQRAEARAEEKRLARDQKLGAALARHSQTEIAEAMGLTRGRVGQLAIRLKASTDDKSPASRAG